MKDGAAEVAERVAGQCVAFRSRRLARLVTRLYDEALRGHGMTVAQFGLLAAIQESAPVQPVELGDAIGMAKSTLSRNLDRLAEAGWVSREDLDRGRGQEVRLTPQGQRALVVAMPAWEEAQAAARVRLGDDTHELLDRLLTE